MKQTPQLEPGEYFVRWVKHAGDGPLADDGEHVIGCRTARHAAEVSADAAFRQATGFEDQFSDGDGLHVDVEDADGQHQMFYVMCEFKVTWAAMPYERPDFRHLVRKAGQS